ncbi:ferritin-like domain-containing protein [Melittangium boletus]|uniref:ferritin-like domain-containing protein n=1 Tax=Melittangium boletus TaxID=83453 RepID=UPI003DA37FFE
MTPSSLPSLSKNRSLRRTLYGLLLAVPALPLVGCDPYAKYGDCGTWQQYSKKSEELPLAEGEPLPRKPSCEPCPRPDHGPTGHLLSCAAEEAPRRDGAARAYLLVCQYDWCNPQDGRRPEGLRDPEVLEADDVLGAFMAHGAWMEAASVPAFLRLAEELAAHGAPDTLVRAARRSAGDEVRHARVMGALAQRHGARIPEVEVTPFTPRSLEELLVENAIEGCVRETYSALSTGWRARHAGDVELRQALRSIARDEVRHAELAWAVDAWGGERLSSSARVQVRQSRRDTLRELEAEVSRREPAEALVRLGGVPSRAQAQRLVQGLGEWVAQA